MSQLLPDRAGETRSRHDLLIAAAQILDSGHSLLMLACAENDGNRDAFPVGQFELVANASVWQEGEIDVQTTFP